MSIASTASLPPLRGKRIFIVEDNLENRFVVRVALAPTGAALEFDAWGRETLRKLHLFAPVHLILLDLMLPSGVSGFTVYDQIRADPQFAQVPVVAVSAADPASVIGHCRKRGFAGFLSKPIDADLFPAQLAQLLQNQPIWQA